MVAVLEDIQANRHWREVFPLEALEGCFSALLLFCAGAQLGAYDGIRVREAGLRDVTAVDKNGAQLKRMRALYPREWTFKEADAWEFSEQAERQWDFVSVDPPTDLAGDVAMAIDLWAGLAAHSLIVGANAEITSPQDFSSLELRKRSEFEGGWYWHVFARETRK